MVHLGAHNGSPLGCKGLSIPIRLGAGRVDAGAGFVHVPTHRELLQILDVFPQPGIRCTVLDNLPALIRNGDQIAAIFLASA